MRTGGKTALTVRGACLAAGLAFSLGFANAQAQIQVSIGDQAVTIRAADTSIRSVLEELTYHVNLVVVSQESLDELVSVDIDEPTFSAAIHRLLRQKSFMLHQQSRASGTLPPGGAPYIRLWIFSGDANDAENAWVMHVSHWPDAALSNEMSDYQILAASIDGRDREEAMYGLAGTGSSSVIAYLRQGLSDSDERVREAAIESLALLGGIESVQALSSFLSDPDAGLRIGAVDALGRIGSNEAIGMLQTAMSDENHGVREAAAEWLTELAWRHD